MGWRRGRSGALAPCWLPELPVSIWEPAKRSCSNTLNVWYSIERGDTVTPPRRVLLPEWFLVHDATDTHPTESGPDSQLEWLSEPDYEIGDAMTGGGRSVSLQEIAAAK